MFTAKSASLQYTCVTTRALPEGGRYSDVSEGANWQQNLCNKPYGSGDKEMSEVPGFQGHCSRFQRKAPVMHYGLSPPRKHCVLRRVLMSSTTLQPLPGTSAPWPRDLTLHTHRSETNRWTNACTNLHYASRHKVRQVVVSCSCLGARSLARPTYVISI